MNYYILYGIIHISSVYHLYDVSGEAEEEDVGVVGEIGNLDLEHRWLSDSFGPGHLNSRLNSLLNSRLNLRLNSILIRVLIAS